MKLFLLSLLVVGALAKDVTKTKDKSTLHDLIFKDDSVFNFGELSKLKIHQRFSTLTVDPSQQHYLDDILLNVDRCIGSFNDDFKTNNDVQKYRYSVGNLVGIILGQIDFVERNNLFNDAGYINDLIGRLKQCDVVLRDTDVVNSNRGIGWLDYWNRGTTGGAGVDSVYLNFIKSGKAVDNSKIYRGGGGVYRDADTTYRGSGGVYRDADTTYRGSGGIYRDTDTTYRGAVNDDYYNTYRGGFTRGDLTGGYRVGDKTSRFGQGYNVNTDGTYGRFQRSLSNYDTNTDSDQGKFGWYRIIYGIINNNDDNNNGQSYLGNYATIQDKDVNSKYGYGDSRLGKNYDGDYGFGYNRFGTGKDSSKYGSVWNRFDNKDLYDNYGYNYDRFGYGKGGYQDIYNRFGGKNVDSYGRKDLGWNGGYYNGGSYNGDTYGRNYYDSPYWSGARDYRVDNLVN